MTTTRFTHTIFPRVFRLACVTLFLATIILHTSSAQVVDVTLQLDTNAVAIGESTTLRVFAQVVPAERTNANRIFSWYIDLLNNGAANASADYNAMVMTESDNTPGFSSSGTTLGDHRTGIYDTFFLPDPLIVPGPGVDIPVELLALPVTGLLPGTTQFAVQAGTGVPGHASDFTVAPLDLGLDLLTGGNYGAASIELTTVTLTCDAVLSISKVGSGGIGEELTLSFTPCPGFNHTIESRAGLEAGVPWIPLPNAPHNAGSLTITNSGSRTFFRLSSTP